MTPVEIVAVLTQNGIPAVIIGGVAMRLHRSTRVTQDLDLCIPSIAIDRAVATLYDNRYVIVTAVRDECATILLSVLEANRWIDAHNPGSLTFVVRPSGLGTESPQSVPHNEIEIESQVDILYDLTVPFGRLLHEAHTVTVNGITVRYATARHLIQLKEARSDRSSADDADIAYLHDLLDRGATDERA